MKDAITNLVKAKKDIEGKLPEVFIEFLKRMYALKHYKMALKSRAAKTPTLPTAVENHRLIEDAFVWINTTDGWKYWERINTAWRNYLRIRKDGIVLKDN